MNMNRPLYWNQGLLLQPHHFQQQDMHFRSLLDPYQRYVQPYLWGVGKLEIQESALGNRTFSLTGGGGLYIGLQPSSRKTHRSEDPRGTNFDQQGP